MRLWTPEFLRTLADFVLPRTCVACGAELAHGRGCVCGACLELVALLKPGWCRHCGRPVRRAKTCAYCRSEQWLDHGRAFTYYIPPVDQMIHYYKYRGFLQIGEFLANNLASLVRSDPHLNAADMIVPVPLHWFKRLRRGYNQSELLALRVAEQSGIPVQNALRRVRSTRTQTRLSPERRARNVRGAFTCVMPVAGRSVLLIDDVMTTGATVKECARVLKEAGCREVNSLVAAITPT